MLRNALVLLTLSLTIAGCGLAGGSTGPNRWELVATSPDDTQLLLTTTFGGVASGCSRFEGWEVDETADRVDVVANLWTKRFPDSCTDEAAGSTVVVELLQPLGDRELIGCTQDDCRTFEDGLSGFDPRPALVANNIGVALMDFNGLKVFDLEGELTSFDSALQLQQPTSAGDLFIANAWPDVVAYDLGQSAISWTEKGQWHATDGEHVYVCEGDEETGTLVKHSVIDGARVWDVPGVCGFVVPLDNSVVVIGFDPEVDGGNELIIVEQATGKEILRRPFDDGLDDQVEGISGATRVGAHAVVFGWQSDTVVIDDAGGEVARRSERLGAGLGAAGELLITATLQQISANNPSTGDVVWSIDATDLDDDATGTSFVLLSDALWLTERGALTQVDATTGERVWSAQVGVAQNMTVTASDSVVYAASPLALTALDRSSGEQLWSSPLPWSGEVITAVEPS